ncbi:hypothetical protein ACWEV3_40120 [Saccharopolyspora sp. NPDC003752]
MNEEKQRRHKAAANRVRAAFIAVSLAALSTVGTALAAEATPDDCIAGSCGLPHWEEPRQGLPHQHVL